MKAGNGAQSDEPEKEDYFCFIHKAYKISERIKGKITSKRNAAIWLRGDYGTGKSTVINLIKGELKFNRTDIIFAHASCWGFSDVQSVQEYVIKEIIEAMTEAGIDTDHLAGIPKQYVRALAKAHTFFDAILEFFFDEKTPPKILEEIDNTLRDNDKKLVLILEDLDRSEEKEFRDPVFATLWRLRNTKHISFIITGFYKQPGKEDPTDYAKICDYVEEMPMITLQQKKIIFKKIAKYHMDELFPGDIKLSEKEFQKLKGYSADTSIDKWFDSFELSRPDWADLPKFGDTPRNLKMFIRDLHAAWHKLHGECDYVELFTLTALRNGNDVGQSVFDFIKENISGLRSPHDDRPYTLTSDAIYQKNSQILELLFPKERLAKDESKSSKGARRVCYYTPVKYFERIINEHIFEDITDQKLLQNIRDWNKGDKKALIEMILNTNNSNVFVCNRWFEAIELNQESLKCLMDGFTEGITKRNIYGFSREKNPHEPIVTLGHLLRYFLHSKNTSDEDEQFLITQIIERLQKKELLSLRPIFYLLAYELVYRTTASFYSGWNTTESIAFFVHSAVLDRPGMEKLTKALMIEFEQGAEPVKCASPDISHVTEYQLETEIKLVQQAAEDWLKKHP